MIEHSNSTVSTVQLSTAQYSSVQYSTAQYSTVQLVRLPCDLLLFLRLLNIWVASAVPGEVADVDQWSRGLLPGHRALAVAVNHGLEDPGKLASSVSLGGEHRDLVL